MTSPRQPPAVSSRSSRRLSRVHRHPPVTDQQRRQAEQRAAVEMARSINEAARQRGAGVMIEASASHGEQQFMLTLANTLRPAEPGGTFDPRFWLQTHKAIGEAIRNRGQLEKLRQFVKQFGPKKPFDATAMVRVMREQLGLPPLPPDPPALAARLNPPADPSRPQSVWEPEA